VGGPSSSRHEVLSASWDAVEYEDSATGDVVEARTNKVTHCWFPDEEDGGRYESCLVEGCEALVPLLEPWKSAVKMVEVEAGGKKELVQPCSDVAQLGFKLVLRALKPLESYSSVAVQAKCHVHLGRYKSAASLLRGCEVDGEERGRRDRLLEKVEKWEEAGEEKGQKTG